MKTNRTLKLITLTAAIFGFAATSFAQNDASATAVASAGIITPITIEGTNLNFGTIFSSSSELEATVTPAGVLSGVTEYNATGSVSHQAATFTVNGNENNTFAISVTNLPTEVTHVTESGVTMAIGNWTSTDNIITFEDQTGSGTSQLASGEKIFSIGATLTIGANQVSGTYTSESFTVKVNYN